MKEVALQALCPERWDFRCCVSAVETFCAWGWVLRRMWPSSHYQDLELGRHRIECVICICIYAYMQSGQTPVIRK